MRARSSAPCSTCSRTRRASRATVSTSPSRAATTGRSWRCGTTARASRPSSCGERQGDTYADRARMGPGWDWLSWTPSRLRTAATSRSRTALEAGPKCNCDSRSDRRGGGRTDGERVPEISSATNTRVVRRPTPIRRRLRLLAFAVTGVGAINVVSALTPEFRGRLLVVRDVFTPEVAHLAMGATALLGVALILLGRGIARHRRVAYRAALALLVISTVTHVLKGFDFEEAVVSLGVAVLLVRSRWLFTAPTPPARWRTAAKVVLTVIPVAFAYGVVGFAIRHNQVKPGFTVLGAVNETAARLVGLTGPYHVTHGFGRWFPASITVLGFGIVIVIAVALLAPVTELSLAPAAERDRIRRLANRRDGDTLHPFALRHDKRYILSADGHAAVAYRYVNGVGLASGDPI